MKSLKLIKLIFFDIIKISRVRFALVILANLMIVILELAGIGAIVPLIQYITSNKVDFIYIFNFDEKNLLIYISLLYLVFLIIKFIIILIIENLNRKYSEKINSILSQNVYEKYLSLDYKYILDNSLSNFTRLVHSDCIRFTDSFNTFIKIAILFLTLLSMIILMGIVSPSYTLFIIFIIFLIAPLFYKITYARVKDLGARWIEDEKKILDMIISGYNNFKDLEIFKLKDILLKKFNKDIKSLLNSKYKTLLINTITRNLVELIGFSLIILFILFHHYSGNEFNDILFKLGIFAVILFRLIPVFNQLVLNLNKINVNDKAINNIYNIVTNEKILSYKSPSKEIIFNKYLEFKDICFGYKSDNFIIKNLNFKIFKNTFNAIIGPNGSGKSTLINLLTGNLQPNKGEILIDGIKISTKSDEWFEKISLVSQDFSIANISISDFISSTKNLKISNKVNELFVNFKLDTKLLDQTLKDSKGVSIGQIQKLCIIRALVKDCEIILFDETTSALDHESINQLFKIIKSFKNKTIIFITHEIKHLNYFDKLNVIKM